MFHEWFVLAIVPILFKGKGKDPDVYNSSRPIFLFIFVFKTLEACWDVKWGHKLEKYNPESQFLFRRGRGCEDLMLLLSLTRNRLLDLGKPAVMTFNDYKNAFQDIEQGGVEQGEGGTERLTGLEAGLWAAGIPHKGIAIFRLIHAAATGIVRLRNAAGVVDSTPFKVSRGGLAGSLTMPAMFSAGVENMLREFDPGRVRGVGIGQPISSEDTKYCTVCYESLPGVSVWLRMVVELPVV